MPNRRVAAILVTALALALCAGLLCARAANTQAVTRTIVGAPPQTVSPVRPGMTPLPAVAPLPVSTIAGLRLQQRPLPPLPAMPKTGGHVRRIQSATGACIVFTYNPGCAADGTSNTTYVAGQSITWHAASLTGTPHTDYVLIPGNAGSPTALSSYAGATGTTETTSNVVAGIYVFASLNTTTNNWDAIAYVLVGSAVSIDTYADGSLSTQTQTFTTTSTGTATVYVGTQGLNPLHNYAVGIEDQLTGYCVYTAPSSSQTTVPSNLCKLNTATLTGTQPTGAGQLVANWGVTLAAGTTPPQGGTYMVTVYDQTGGQRVASRLFSIIDGRATGSTGRVNLEFSNRNGTSPAGRSRIAWNGTSTTVNDPSATYMNLLFGANTLPSASDRYTMVVTDPSGNVATSFTNVSYGSATIPPTGQQWGLPDPSIPFELAYPGSTWTATVYDATTKKLVASQSFQILGYSASALWNGNSPTLTAATSTAATLTFTNTGDSVFGPNNSDPIQQFLATSANTNFNKITMTPPATGVLCTPSNTTPCSESVTDTSGNGWTVTLTCTGGCGGTTPTYTIQAVPVSASTPLVSGASVTVQGLTLYTSNCTGTTGCYFNNAVYPADAVTSTTPSSGYQVINPVSVSADTTGVSATGSIVLAGYYDSGNTYHASQDLYTPRFNQASLALNQPFTGAASSVVYGLTIKNTSTYIITILQMILPSSFTLTSVAADSHTPNGFTITANGSCNGLPLNTACITPTTPIPANGSQTYYFKVNPPSASFSYTDLGLTVVQSSYNYGGDIVPITATTSSVNTFIGSPTTVDSLAMGVYSINGGLMIGQITPGSVGTNTSNTLSFTLQNTTTGSDPFPDYVDMAVVQVPNQSYITVPTTCSGITVNTTGWSCLSATGGAGLATTYYLGQCSQQASTLPTVPVTATSLGSDNLAVCPFARPNEPYSLSPGSTLSFSIPVTAGATATGGTPVTVSSWAHGATTDAWTTPITSTVAVAATATAGVGFASINGVPVANGSEPQVIQNTPTSTGNTYLYKIRNTGSVGITSATIVIPGPDTTGTNGQDSSGQAWVVTPTGSPAATLLVEGVGTADGCTSTVINPSPANGTNTGTIAIACPAGALISGRTLDVTFTALAPLKINSTYLWSATINGTIATSPNWFSDNQILIALSASVGVTVNNVTCTVKAASGNAAPTITPATYTMNFGTVNKNTYTYCPDVMTATVITDSNAPSTWSLYVSADANPSATGASLTGAPGGASTTNELNIMVDTATSTSTANTCPTSGVCLAYDTTSYAPILTTSSGNGTRLAYTTNGGSKVMTNGVSVLLNEAIAVGTETVPTTGYSQTLTFTWVSN